ncbi:hypothetical protein AcW1_006986 [Taiwanofungus camphoratus]|nr:hypothetical protein AcW1_006986 [Antrodia cinnamomea]
MFSSVNTGFRSYTGYACNTFPTRRVSGRYLALAAAAVLVVLMLYYTALHQHSAPLEQWIGPHWSEYNETSSDVWNSRAEQVKRAFVHAYHGYEVYAAPHDELLPLSNKSKDNFNGWGVSIFDSLDTMILMGLNEEFGRALPVVERANFSLPPDVISEGRLRKQYAPFFETVIRYLGGLLSAYALSHEPILLQRADDLGRMLSPAFNTESGLPLYAVNTDDGATHGPGIGILAEVASCQLEYTYLAQMTGRKEYFEKANNVIQTLARANVSRQGDMFPKRWNLSSGRPVDDVLSVGAAADSAHEYLLKQYLLTAKSDVASLQMYLRTTNHILTHLLYLSDSRDLLYVTDSSRGSFLPSHRFEHLSCFLPGLLALGAHTLDLSLDDLDPATLGPEGLRSYKLLQDYDLPSLHRWAAEGLATTCWMLYADQPSGLGPDEVYMQPTTEPDTSHMRFSGHRASQAPTPAGGKLWIDAIAKWRESGEQAWPPGLGEKVPMPYTQEEIREGNLRGSPLPKKDYALRRTDYLLRPETIESLFVLFRTTGNPVWRERGWFIFEAIERETKTATGYASVKNVLRSPAALKDDMPSYFLAETLKYLYLLFHGEELVPFDRWVFNTEAHPLPVFTWSAWERHKFGISKPSP